MVSCATFESMFIGRGSDDGCSWRRSSASEPSRRPAQLPPMHEIGKATSGVRL